MKKTLLILVALLMGTSFMFAKEEKLSLTNLGSGWSSSYDAATKTITFDGSWVGRGWWFGEPNGKDCSDFTEVVVKFEACTFQVQLVVEYNGGVDATKSSVNAGATSVTITLNKDGKGNVKQIYIQNGAPGTLTLTDAYLIGDAGGETGGSAVINFEKETQGKTFPMMHAWGWSDAGSKAIVVADPLGVNGNSLEVVAGNYDGCVYFDVTFPAGSTIADLNAIKFDCYFGAVDVTGTIEIFLAAPSATIGSGTGFASYPVYLKTNDAGGSQLQVAAGGKWFTHNITKENIENETYNVKGNKPNFAAINDLNKFKFGIGISMEGGTKYYMDNIIFVLGDDGDTGIIPIKQSIPNVYNVAGGIKVNTLNEKVSIFSIDGRLVKQTAGNSQFISLPQGLYIVKAGDAKAVKVIVQ